MGSHWDINANMPQLPGKVAIVTGGNTGLGKEIVRQLATHGAKVYMASRTEARARSAIEGLHAEHPEIPKGNIEFLPLDLTDLKGSQQAAKLFLEKEKRLDILINNAGIMATPYELTEDGFEIQFQSNYLGHFAFTYPLLPLLIETSKDPATSVRIVQVSSMGHNFATKIDQPCAIKLRSSSAAAAEGETKTITGVDYTSTEAVNRDFGSTWKRYGQSKLANILFARKLAARLAEHRIWSSAVHPGNIQTELNRGTAQSYPWIKPFLSLTEKLFLVTPYKGAITPLYVATAEEIEQKDYRGQYFVPLAKHEDPSALAQNDKLADDLWEYSEKVVTEKCGGLA